MHTTALAYPWQYGQFAPPVWAPEDASSDLLQYWNDILDPTIANPAELSYRPIFRYNGNSAGSLRPYQPGRCYLGDRAAYTEHILDLSTIVATGFTVLLRVRWVLGNVLTVGVTLGSGNACVFIGQSGEGFRVYCGNAYGTGIPVEFGEEYTLAVTYDGNNNSKTADFYIDGVYQNSTPSTIDISSDCNLYLGGAYNSKMEGDFWDARMYDGILTPEQILAYHNGTLGHLPNNILTAKCDEGSGDISYDSSGNGNHGTIYNNYEGFHSEQDQYSFQNEVGYSVYRVFKDDSVSVAADSLILGRKKTISGWAQNTETTSFTIFKADPTATHRCSVTMYLNNVTWDFGDGPGRQCQKTLDFDMSYPRLITCTADADAQEMKIFVDGVLWHSTNAAEEQTASGSILIGRGPTGYPITGILSDIRIYNRALTEPEVLGLFNNIEPDTTGFIANWKLNEPSGLTAYDSVADNHGVYDGTDVVYIPRNEATPAEDILGNLLQYTGRAQGYGALKNLPCLTSAGLGEYISAPHLTGTETITSYEGTSTPSISAGRIDFTAGTLYNIVLDDGTHYPCYERGGITLHDVVGGNHAQLKNYTLPTIWTDSSQNTYTYNQKNGISNLLESASYHLGVIPIDDPLQLQGDFTVALRLYGSVDHVNYFGLLDNATAGSGTDGISILYKSSRVYVFIDTVSVAYSNVLDNSIEKHIVVTKTVAGNYIFYVNGVDETDTTGTAMPPIVEREAVIGGRINNSTTIQGTIYDFRIYERALSPAEISDWHTSQTEPADTDLIHHWLLTDIRSRGITRGRYHADTVHKFQTTTLPTTGAFWVSGWFLPSSASNRVTFIQGTDFRLEVTALNPDTYRWTVGSTSVVQSILNPTISSRTLRYHYIMAYCDGENIGLIVDDRPPVTAVQSSPGKMDGNLRFGSTNVNSLYYLGVYGNLYAGTGAAPDLYNKGAGYHWLDNPPGEIHGAWMCNETSGDLIDWSDNSNDFVSVQVDAGSSETTTVGRYGVSPVFDKQGNRNIVVEWSENSDVEFQYVNNPNIITHPQSKLFLPTSFEQIDWRDNVINLPWAISGAAPAEEIHDSVSGVIGTNYIAASPGIGTYYTENSFGYQLNAGAVNSHIRFPDGSLPETGDISVSFWVVTFVDNTVWNRFLCMFSGSRARYLQFSYGTLSGLSVKHKSVNTTVTSSGAGVLEHYVFNIPDSGTVTVYKNGIIQATTTLGPSALPTYSALFSGYDETTYNFNGGLADVRLLNGLQDQTSVDALMNNPLVALGTELLWFDFSEGPITNRRLDWPSNYIYGETTNGQGIHKKADFRRLRLTGEDRHLHYREDLTGKDLTNAREYVGLSISGFSSGFSGGFE